MKTILKAVVTTVMAVTILLCSSAQVKAVEIGVLQPISTYYYLIPQRVMEDLTQEKEKKEDETIFEYEKLYTDEDVTIISKIVLREAEGVPANDKVSGDAQRAAVVWCILNRVDAGYGTIKEVATAKRQFAYYPKTKVKDGIKELVVDVLDRWSQEQAGAEDVGRVLPQEYMWFVGDGTYNHFRNKYNGNYDIWDWSLDDPYGD